MNSWSFSGISTLFLLISLIVRISGKSVTPKSDSDWFEQGQESLRRSLIQRENNNIARNVILFLGDGMGVTSVTAARIYRGQKRGESGEENVLNFEKFPDLALSKTYNTDRQVADSAGTATAILSGVKTKIGFIGVNQNALQMDCNTVKGNELDSILDWSQKKGKWTGLVTTTRLTHATPASAYGHAPWRFWESDIDIPTECRSKFHDLSVQLLIENSDIRVLLGGGRSFFTSQDTLDPEYPDKTGRRTDGRNLIQEWEQHHSNSGHKYKYVWNATEFSKVNAKNTDYLLGVFEPSHMKYEIERARDPAGEPSLADMTEKAIRMLNRKKEGYFLLVEGGKIDHGHHECSAKRALEDTLSFEDAIQTALDITDQSETLIVVTADHSHTLTLGSYMPRGADILGFTDEKARTFMGAKDEFPIPGLMYANGPGPSNRSAMVDVDPTSDDFKQPALVPSREETHGGEDVAIYALGPMSHLFNGVQEQNYIAHVMAYASCVGSNTEHCDRSDRLTANGGVMTVYTATALISSLFSVSFVQHHLMRLQ